MPSAIGAKCTGGKRRKAVRTPGEKEMAQHQIAATDGQIDRLVYELPQGG